MHSLSVSYQMPFLFLFIPVDVLFDEVLKFLWYEVVHYQRLKLNLFVQSSNVLQEILLLSLILLLDCNQLEKIHVSISINTYQYVTGREREREKEEEKIEMER